ncbi:MAG: hypothetical protein A3J70_03540, partial [Elusimicrobia bacterium RIFCSPHIGHO2_02_FULL_61_10]
MTTLIHAPADRDTLKRVIREKIGDRLFVVVSNREPYIHRQREGRVTVQQPASGVVTALDPMLQTCEGLWVAHGSGTADRKVVDERGRIRVPPENPQYTLKRVWLTKEEEEGYYYGFSNETLWPLCHIAFTPPKFEERYWRLYQQVNQKFADTVLEEIGDQSAFVWVQDYHFALLPQMLKERRGDLAVAQFWHIPWPNPEVFRICPWGRQILEGMLGNDLLGFHVSRHCENFINSVEQMVEVRVDRQRPSIYHHGGIETQVRTFPIGVDFDQINRDVTRDFSKDEDLQSALKCLPEKCEYLAVSVDRIDYTKGIPESIEAMDRFFEKYPEMLGKFVFLRLGSISRIHIGAYKELNERINAMVEQINWKYAADNWQPVVFLRRELTYPEILVFYR